MVSACFAGFMAMPENDAPNVTSSRGTSLVRALLDLQRERKWGTLDVEGAGVNTRVYVADGKPVFAERGTLSDTLGRLLLREGVLTMAQYTAVLARMGESLSKGKPIRFGEAAIALGFFTPKQVQESLAAQVKQKVARCIALSHATFNFTASRDWANKVRRFPTPIEPVVLYASSSFDSERVDTMLRAGKGTRARLLKDPSETATAFMLGAAEKTFLSTIDGRRTVRELLTTDGVDASAILVALALSDHLAITDASKPLPSDVPPPPEETARAPHVSYAELIREKRGRLLDFTASKGSGTAQADAMPAPPKTPEHAHLLAETAFQLGAGYLRSNSLARAVEELRRAVTLSPEEAEYMLFAKWADFANEQSKLEVAEKGAQLAALEVSAEAALEQVTDLGFAHYVLGQVYLNEGDDDRALRSFKRAARLDPELIDADRHVRLLELRRRRSSQAEIPAERPSSPKPAPVQQVASEDLETIRPPAPPPMPAAAKPPVPEKPVAADQAKADASPAPPAAKEEKHEPKVIIAPMTPPLPMIVQPPHVAPTAKPAPARAKPPPAAAMFGVEPITMPEADVVPLPPFEVEKVEKAENVEKSATTGAPEKTFERTEDSVVARFMEAPPAQDTNAPIETNPPPPRRPRAGARLIALIAIGATFLIAAVIGLAVIVGHSRAKASVATTTAVTMTTRGTATVETVAPDPTTAHSTVTADTAPSASATASQPAPTASATAATTASASGASSSSEYGEIEATSTTSAGHRLIVDGHSVGDAPGPFRVKCGSHKVQLGSHGKPRTVRVECGATTDIDAH